MINLKLLNTCKRGSAHRREKSYYPNRLKHQGTAYDSSLTQREYGSITSIAYSSTWNIAIEINLINLSVFEPFKAIYGLFNAAWHIHRYQDNFF